jgi:hypothetical protein
LESRPLTERVMLPQKKNKNNNKLKREVINLLSNPTMNLESLDSFRKKNSS